MAADGNLKKIFYCLTKALFPYSCNCCNSVGDQSATVVEVESGSTSTAITTMPTNQHLLETLVADCLRQKSAI